MIALKRVLLAATLLLVTLLALGCGGESVPKTAEARSGVEIKMLDVGQGDSILVRTRTQTVLIDTSDVDEREKLRAALERENVKVVDKLIITHPHADHLGGAAAVLRLCEVRHVYDNGQPHSAKLYRDYLKAIKAKKIPYKSLKDGDRLDFGDGCEFAVLSPTPEMVKEGGHDENGKINYNLNSVVGRLTYGGHFAMLFTGDGEAVTESGMLKRHKAEELRSDILKSPHHGSKTSSGAAFLRAVGPKVAVISCGAGNSYSHPHKSILNKYRKNHITWYRTDANGTITIQVDANGYACKPEKGKASDETSNYNRN